VLGDQRHSLQPESATSPPSAFVIAASAHAAALRRRLEHDPAIAVFCESESLEALRLIVSHPPRVVALDGSMVRTARGALIVSQLRELGGVDVRVLTEDEGRLPVLLVHRDITLHAATHPLEGCGTRDAKRVPITPGLEIVVDGERSRLVNLSTTGAQLVVNVRIQPRQRVRLTLIDDKWEKRLNAVVAWSTIEMAQSAVMYRAGVTFVDPDADAIAAFCVRHTFIA
jgi:hypothetical protein